MHFIYLFIPQKKITFQKKLWKIFLFMNLYFCGSWIRISRIESQEKKIWPGCVPLNKGVCGVSHFIIFERKQHQHKHLQKIKKFFLFSFEIWNHQAKFVLSDDVFLWLRVVDSVCKYFHRLFEDISKEIVFFFELLANKCHLYMLRSYFWFSCYLKEQMASLWKLRSK